jgi:hypothetical protein
MPVARPATAEKDLFSRLQLFLRGNHELTKFDVRRLEADAHALKNAEPAQAFIALSAIAALKWDFAAAQYWAEQAVKIRNDQATWGNASLVFRYLNRCDVAADYAQRGVQLAPLDMEVADDASGILAADGRLADAQRLIDEYQVRSGKQGTFEIQPAVFVAGMAHLGIDESQLQRELRAAMEVLTEEQIRHIGVTYQSEPEPDGGVMISVFLEFGGTHEDEIRLESKLARVFADMEEWNPCKLSVALQHQSIDVGQPA